MRSELQQGEVFIEFELRPNVISEMGPRLISEKRHKKKCLKYVYTNLYSLALIDELLDALINSLRPIDAYMRQYINHHWFK